MTNATRQPNPAKSLFCGDGHVLRCVWRLLLLVAVLGLPVGCSDSKPPLEPLPERPLRAMNSAIRKGQWQQAWNFSDAVLEKHADSAEAIASVARVAYELGKADVSAELLLRSCRAESFGNAQRVQQTLIAMIGVGRLHEGMQMLEETVEQQPMQHATRRLLYDLYMGSEQRQAGLPHGRFLVRQRQFDLELLQTLSNTERRTQDSQPLTEMTTRNPNDKRPLLGDAKNKFDLGQYDDALEILQSITDAHDDFLPAQALLGRVLAAASKFDQLEQWASEQSEGIQSYPGYWLAVGDWARSKQQMASAARAYWEATRRDPDVMESWSKLSTTLQQLSMEGTPAQLSDEMLAGARQRATLLSTFNQQKSRFERTGSISRAIVVDIVQTLRDLGRLWEAEAWASLALSLPEDDAVPTEKVRASIVAELRKETPWQLTEPFPELRLDLASLDLPRIGGLVAAGTSETSERPDAALQVEHIGLVNEAAERGLKFFGRTADDLDQPGIMLYETLGCGGGTLDFDLDGWSDLYLVNAGGTPPAKDSEPNALMRNREGNFVEVTAPSGTGDRGFGQGVAVGDVNSDGFPDLLVLNYGPNTLMINNGDGTFSDASDKLGNNADHWSTAGAIADLDGDAISDLVIVNYCAGLEPVTTTCPMKDSDISRSCTPMKFAGQGDSFLQGSADGSFTDRTKDWSEAPSVVGRGLGVVVGSFDNDPGVDIFVANDMTNNHYWSKPADSDSFRLVESAMVRGLGTDDRSLAQGSMGIAAADFDGDLDIDFYVTNFDKEYNTYHQQRGGIWQDQTSRLQLAAPAFPLVGFGTEAIDLENDGTLELVVSNGHVDMFSRADERSLYAQPMQIFRRNRLGTFDSIAQWLSGEYLKSSHVGRALWTIDANRDGLADFAVTHQTEPVALLVNQSKSPHSQRPGNWLALQLVGRQSSRDAIGAEVEVSVGDQKWRAVQTSGDGYLCSNERLLRFGLGQASDTCDVQVTWPDGTIQTHRNLETNAIWLLVQADDSAHQQR